jgi:hypothetical protein
MFHARRDAPSPDATAQWQAAAVLTQGSVKEQHTFQELEFLSHILQYM